MSKGNRIRNKRKEAAIENSAILAANAGMAMGLTPYQAFFEIAEHANAGQAIMTLTAMKPVIKQSLSDISYKSVADLAISANYKVWQHYKSNPKLAAIYQELWEMIDGYALNNLKGEELNFYIKVTD